MAGVDYTEGIYKTQTEAETEKETEVMNMIVCADSKWGIGRDGGLLCDFPEDLEFFRKMTEGHAVVMGRKTYESIGHPLKNRVNYVLTHHFYNAAGAIAINDTALKSGGCSEAWLIGGAEIYNQFYKGCDLIFVTKILKDMGADTFIVDLDADPNFEKVIESAVMYHGDEFAYMRQVYARRHCEK